jgi:hypothetical protein
MSLVASPMPEALVFVIFFVAEIALAMDTLI